MKLNAKEIKNFFGESDKMNNSDPYKYLTYVLEVLSTKGLKDLIIESILPYSKSFPNELYIKK